MSLPPEALKVVSRHLEHLDDYDPQELLDELRAMGETNLLDIWEAFVDHVNYRTAKAHARINRLYYGVSIGILLAVSIFIGVAMASI